jgi:hypothetical protein
MAQDDPKLKARWWRRILTVPGLILTTVLTTAVSWGVTAVLARVTSSRAVEHDPIAVSLETDPSRISGISTAGVFGVIPASVHTQGSPGSGCEGFHSWLNRNHGIEAGRTSLQLVLQGESDSAVLISAMRVRVLAKLALQDGIPVACPTAGEAQVRSISVNLDTTPPTVDYRSNSTGTFGFTLAKGETETFLVTASASRATYRWAIDLEVVIDGARKTLRVGEPDGLWTTARPSGPHWEWNFRDAWSLVSPDSGSSVQKSVPANSPLAPVG